MDSRVVGDVAARLEPPVEDAPRQLLRDLGRVRLRVDALAVAEAYRRRGVGARLLRAVEEWGRARGAVRSVLTTYGASPLSCRSTSRAWATAGGRSCSRSGSTRLSCPRDVATPGHIPH
jgi:GNAT superfamily N-acetyltransferase